MESNASSYGNYGRDSGRGRGRGRNGRVSHNYEQNQHSWGYGHRDNDEQNMQTWRYTQHDHYEPNQGYCHRDNNNNNEQNMQTWRNNQHDHYEPKQQQNWAYGHQRSYYERNEEESWGLNGTGRNAGNAWGRNNDEHNQQGQGRGRAQPGRTGGDRGRRGCGTHPGGSINRRPFQGSAPTMPQQQLSGGSGGGFWTGKSWGESPLSNKEPQKAYQAPQETVELNLQSWKVSEQKQLSSSAQKVDNKIVPMLRPDSGTIAVKSVNLLANHFLVKFNPNYTIIHYDVNIKPVASAGNQPLTRSVPKNLLGLIKDKFLSDKSQNLPLDMVVAFDGEKNIFSAVQLPTGEFNVEFSVAEDAAPRSYVFTIKKVNELKLSKLKDYLNGNLSYIPREILQGMDLVMKENPCRNRITVGRSFYCKNFRERDDFKCGVAAYRGFHQSLKPTSQGLSLCVDYSILTLRKPMPVLDFLKESVNYFNGVNDVNRMRQEVTRALKGLKVRVNHRETKQEFTISGLTSTTTSELSFDLARPDSKDSSGKIGIVDFFWQKYGKKIYHLDIPCLDLGKGKKINFVPMEFCVLVEGQRFLKERLDKGRADLLKKMSLACPEERKSTICEMVQADDGPGGIVAKNFGMEVEKYMTSVQGRVLGAPELKLRAKDGKLQPLKVDQDKCHWNLVGRRLMDGKRVDRWALIDFTSSKLPVHEFVAKLKNRSWNLGMQMEDPLVCHFTGMYEFSSVERIEKLLKNVVADARHRTGSQGMQLQVIVCVMARRDPGYKYLKWVSETQIGVVTQCCLSHHASKGQDQYLGNLCLKINAKLGGSNVELNERLPHFVDGESVMFIGADVNHPDAKNSISPSIAAVVGTINWPAYNKYAARIQSQEHRKEKIMNFGSICRDLVDTFAKFNKFRPKKIIVFRDGVSEGQFDMVLNEELLDLMQAICDDDYKPTITLVVAQKRHQTRLFLDRRDGGAAENVPPGTVVDTKIVHPFEFDFYLCSHYGSLGTSKPTHYYVLWDENAFTSDTLQKLIYNLCFTYARCTKPVSLVPPVYYADLVAYRGRLFQEVELEKSSTSSAISSASMSMSMPSFAASFQQNFNNLHPDIQDVMYFV